MNEEEIKFDIQLFDDGDSDSDADGDTDADADGDQPDISDAVVTQTIGGGTVIRGRPGLFFPDDAYRLDQAWAKMATVEDAIFDVSFMGDVEGAFYKDASGTKVAELTIADYDAVKRITKTQYRSSTVN